MCVCARSCVCMCVLSLKVLLYVFVFLVQHVEQNDQLKAPASKIRRSEKKNVCLTLFCSVSCPFQYASMTSLHPSLLTLYGSHIKKVFVIASSSSVLTHLFTHIFTCCHKSLPVCCLFFYTSLFSSHVPKLDIAQ